mmetsp:Transcript_56778/g.176078  ORF Transcript_56778/g.176078 Transcript_56778/m.176078 type:complete len:322 (+) Transcript_56778:128-1093(+)
MALDAGHGVLPSLATARYAKRLETPAIASLLAKEPGDDQCLFVPGLVHLIEAELVAVLRHHSAIGVGDQGEGLARGVDVDDEDNLLHALRHALEVHCDDLVVALARAREVVARVGETLALLLAEEDAVPLLGLVVEQHGRDVEVNLAPRGVPTQARFYALQHGRLWKVDNRALVHLEGRFDALGSVRDHGANKVPDDRLKDVDEVPPVLGGHLHQAEEPPLAPPDQRPYEVDLLLALFQLEASHLLVGRVLQEGELAVVRVPQVSAAGRRKDECHKGHLRVDLLQVHPHNLVQAVLLPGELIAGVREAVPQGLQVVVVHRI